MHKEGRTMKIRWAADILVIFVGCLLIGIAFNAFFDRFGLAPGGLSGLFVIINHTLNIDLWISNLAFNVPLYLAAYKTLSREEWLKTLCGILFCSLAFRLTSFLTSITTVNNPWLACLFGGLLLGAGTGIIFRVKGSTGGTGLLATILKTYIRRISLPKIMGVADGLIVLLSAVSSGKLITAIYSAAALGLVVVISDLIIAWPMQRKVNSC